MELISVAAPVFLIFYLLYVYEVHLDAKRSRIRMSRRAKFRNGVWNFIYHSLSGLFDAI
ncbi:MAG: hypothetical protein ABJF50_10430 [Paracoccaceae bacterium]